MRSMRFEWVIYGAVYHGRYLVFTVLFKSRYGISSRVSDPDWIRIQLGPWIRIRNPDPDPGGQK
jgi:hypothetical protein